MNISVLWFLVSFIKHKIKAGFLYLVRSHGRMKLSKLSLKNYQMMGQKFKKKIGNPRHESGHSRALRAPHYGSPDVAPTSLRGFSDTKYSEQ